MAEEDSHIQKTRTTALKVIVDEQLVNDVNKTREFMSKVFDMPKLLEKKEVIKRTCRIKNGDRTFETAIDPAFAETMISVGLDITKLPEFKEEPDTKYVMTSIQWDTTYRNS